MFSHECNEWCKLLGASFETLLPQALNCLKCLKWDMIPWMQMKFNLCICGLAPEVKSTHIPPRVRKIFFSLTHPLTPLPSVSHPLPLQISFVIYSKTHSQSDFHDHITSLVWIYVICLTQFHTWRSDQVDFPFPTFF